MSSDRTSLRLSEVSVLCCKTTCPTLFHSSYCQKNDHLVVGEQMLEAIIDAYRKTHYL